MINIGIIGGGFIGSATKILETTNNKITVYDIDSKLCYPDQSIRIEDMYEQDVVFISVPTPMNPDGSCNLDILDSVVGDLQKHMDFDKQCVVIRSTVPVGTSKKYNCYFMPEFLTEKNWVEDFRNCKDWIFGIKNTEQDKEFKQTINEIFHNACMENKILHNMVHFIGCSEAEMVKLFRNTFLALKVSYCNEIKEFCDKVDINYEVVRKYGAVDSRIGMSHTSVPGPDGIGGFGGTCFPKDTASMVNQMETINMKSYILKNAQDRNNKVDRKEHDWESNKGRAVV